MVVVQGVVVLVVQVLVVQGVSVVVAHPVEARAHAVVVVVSQLSVEARAHAVVVVVSQLFVEASAHTVVVSSPGDLTSRFDIEYFHTVQSVVYRGEESDGEVPFSCERETKS